jgi:hypothetical protein
MIPIGDEYDDKRVMTEFSIRRSMKKERDWESNLIDADSERIKK